MGSWNHSPRSDGQTILADHVNALHADDVSWGGDVSAGGHKLANLAAPTNSGDAVNLATLQAVASARSKAISVLTPVDTDDIALFFTVHEITITALSAVVAGGTPSVTWTIRFAANRDDAGTEVVTGGTETTSESGQQVTSLDEPVVPANSWLKLLVTATDGVPSELHVTIHY